MDEGSTAAAPDPGLRIGDVMLAGRVLAAPMTGVTDLPFRRTLSRLGAPYVATEMVACADLAAARPDVVRRSALGGEAGPRVVQIVGREAKWLAQGARLAEDGGAQIVDINMGCPAKAVTGLLAGSALMRDLDQAEALIGAAVEATSRPVTLKMRLGWDAACINAPALAARAQAAGVKAITVHARTRQQFYTGVADWPAVAAVRAATRLPLIVNGDIVDAASAKAALARSGADAVMVGRALTGRPWLPAQIQAALQGLTFIEPDATQRLEIVMAHLEASLSFHGEALGLRTFRKHLAGYIEQAPWPAEAVARRTARADLCRLDRADDVREGLRRLWLG